MARHAGYFVVSFAGALMLGSISTVSAQSTTAYDRAAPNSAVVRGAANGTAATEKGKSDTGRNAVARRVGASATAPISLAIDASPGPASTPEPISMLLVGGALAGLYRMRRHLS